MLNFFKRYCKTSSVNVRNTFFKKNKEYIILGSIFGSILYSIFYTYKKNTSINVRILPPIPIEGVIFDEAKIQLLCDKFGKSIKKSKKTEYFCFYGPLGSGKSTLLRNFGCKLFPESKSSIIYPRSNILAFLNCSSKDSLIDSLIEFTIQLNPHRNFIEIFDSLKLDLKFDDLVDYLMKDIFDALKKTSSFFILLDNINPVSYKELAHFFNKYAFSEEIQKLNGSMIFICDTEESLLPSFKNTLNVAGLSLNSAYNLFLMHSKIDKSSLSISDPAISSILHLTHFNPLSLISIALMVQENLKSSQDMSIKQSIKSIEDLVIDKVKTHIHDTNINISPETFEYLYSENALKLFFENYFEQKNYQTKLKLTSILSLISPSIETPETLVAKLLNNLNTNVNASDFFDLIPKIQENSSLKDKTYTEQFFSFFSEGKRIFQEAKNLKDKLVQLNQSDSNIRYSERISLKNKSSPFLNISKKDNQDFLSLHPIIYNLVRHNFFKENYLLFDISENLLSNINVNLLSFIFTTPVRITDIWSRLCVSSGFTTEDIQNVNLKNNKLLYIINEILNGLAHSDPVRYQNRSKLALIRSRHLNFLIKNFDQVISKADNDKSVIADKDLKFILRLYGALLNIYTKLNMHKYTLSLFKKAEIFMNGRVVNYDSRFRDELIEIYLFQTDALISELKLKDALANLKILWKMVEPYIVKSYPVASAKLILLILKYNQHVKTPFNTVSNLDLVCHALQKINLASMDKSLPMEQLAEEMMETYIYYGYELAKNNYDSYASYLIDEAEKFNIEIFKENKKERYSPFDKKLFDLKLFFENIRGNIQMVKILKQSMIDSS